jgi:hypothetical protein
MEGSSPELSSGETMNSENRTDEEEAGPDVTDEDLHQLEDDRLVDEGENSLPEALGFGLGESTEKLWDMSQQTVYLTLLHFAKSICSRAAEDPVWARRTMVSFREMRDAMYGQSNESPNVADLQPAKGRLKGRPRKSQIARQAAYWAFRAAKSFPDLRW